MSSFKEKTQAFIMGLMAGLIIAGTFFVLKLDNYFKELNFYKNIVKTFSFKNEAKLNQVVENTKEQPVIKEKKNKGKEGDKSKINADNDSVNATESGKNFILDADTIANVMVKDTIAPEKKATQEDIVIRKDELLAQKLFDVVVLNASETNVTSSKDSLLQKVSGIKEDKPGLRQLSIELWQSPLNYRGYKMGKSKVVLYGLQTIDGIKLYTIGSDTYLKNGSSVYKLEATSEFKPYERVSDETLLGRMK